MSTINPAGVLASPPPPALTLPETGPAAAPVAQPGAESLLDRLAAALHSRGIKYCQWKGHWSSHRWASGHGDVDLLVAREALPLFRRVVGELGFKSAQPAGYRALPGIESYFGYDPVVPRLLHLHVHYRLVLGDYWKPVYRIPLERQLLDSAVPGEPFPVPAPTHRFIVFVLRLMLRQVGRPLLSVQSRWTSGVEIQLESLESCSSREELAAIVQKYLGIELSLFDRCVRSLRGECGGLERALLPWLLHLQLRPHVRRPPLGAVLSAAVEKGLASAGYRRTPNGERLSTGGAVLALVGGDGAGKSTCARELVQWLSPTFPTTHAHLGNPSKSMATLAIGGALKLQQGLARHLTRTPKTGSLLELLRHLCTARDRHRLYVKVHRFAAAGGISICERYPIEQNRALVGPMIPSLVSADAGRISQWLCRTEASYYHRILRPDMVAVLRLDPELAVARKPDEPAEYVRTRNQIIWNTDWSLTDAHIVDASRSLPQVLQQLKTIIWSAL